MSATVESCGHNLSIFHMGIYVLFMRIFTMIEKVRAVSVIMIVKYQMVLSGTFPLEFFMAVDPWKIFSKIQVIELSVFGYTIFGTWSHILVPPSTLV